MIRPATLQDVKQIQLLALEEVKDYPLRPDRQKMTTSLQQLISDKKHFTWVVEVAGKVQGALITSVGSDLWSQRQNCNAVLWVSRVPGQGAALVREFKRWLYPRRGIKVAGFVQDKEWHPAIGKLLERLGFEKHGGAYLMYT